MKFSVIIRMRNNVVSCANKTVKLNVLHPYVDTLKNKLQAFELQHMVRNILLRVQRSEYSSFTNTTYDKAIFLPLNNKLEIRVNGTIRLAFFN